MRKKFLSAFADLSARLLPALVALALIPSAPAAIIDLNSDGVSDIWALKYGVTSFSATKDSDGDGASDAAEAGAGTNPFNANSTVRIVAVTQDANGMNFTFPTLLGKAYVLQKSASLASPSWVAEGGLRKGTGGDLTATIPAAGATQYFYRVVVQDMDTDADGVSDWEELAVGFDPFNAYSNGLSASNDFTRITQALGATNEVTVTVLDSTAVEPAAGSPATQTGAFEIRRTGNLNPITVTYTMSGTASKGTDYQDVSGSVTLGLGVNSALVVITPLADALVESPESVILTVTSSAAYTVGAASSAALLIDDKATATGTGITARFWNNTSATIPVFTNTNVTPNTTPPVLTRVHPQVNNTWTGSPGTGVSADYFVTRYTGEVLPEFSQIYTFQAQVDKGVRLWVNGQQLLNNWSNNPNGGTFTATIELQAGQRVPIVLEHMSRTGTATVILSWQSANQALQVIPQARLFPVAPPQILSSLEMLLIRNGPQINYQIVASGEPTGYNASNLPPGWSINTSTGQITGSPTTAGSWPILLTATNTQGSGSAILNLTVIETGGGINRDVWAGTFASLGELPLAANPTTTDLVSALEGPQAPGGGDYGARLRGYITAPETGVYKFWITGSDSAELWISDDDEPVNLFRRAATTGPTGYRQWTSANAGKSPLLQLRAGQRYAVEVRHIDPGADGHVSVGWLKPSEGGVDPAAATSPSEVIPGYILSPYVAPAIINGQSTLFATSLTAQGAAVTSAYGSGSLRLSADESEAVLVFSYANLTSSLTGRHIHSGTNAEIIFDIDATPPNPDGSYTWHIAPVGAFSAADIRNLIKTGNTYLNVHSVFYPAGEIKGFLKLQAASQTFTPPAAQAWNDPGTDTNPESALNPQGASRFLGQATFGASAAEIASVKTLGYAGWINDQISKPTTKHFPFVYANRNQTDPTNNAYTGALTFNAWWRNSVTAPDQLRQRVAFALSEIFVISESGPLDERADAISDYYDMLLTNAFGNVRTLLENVTLHPAMGRYLDMLRNARPDKATGRIPNENYAREIEQLFSIGLYRMHPDGSLMLNSKGELIPTYDQDAIIGFAHVFTGWDYAYTGTQTSQRNFGASENWTSPMREVPTLHFTGQKRLLNNVVLPGLATIAGVPLDPYATHTSAQYTSAPYQALPAQELAAAHDALFNHPNIGPFLCRQLIQRLVTSTPSRGYLYRVVQKFENNGSGVRGDMAAVIKAILLDYEARSATLLTQQGYGKQREPVLRVTALARAFPKTNLAGTYSQSASLVTVTTTANHLYAAGQSVYLDFDAATGGEAGAPADALYTVLATPAPTATTFAVRTRSYEGSVTYARTGSIVRFTGPAGGNGFRYAQGESIYAEYLDGTVINDSPVIPASGLDTIEYVSDDEQQLVFALTGAKRCSYTQAATSTALTITSAGHGYTAGTVLRLDFLTPTATLPVSGNYTVAAATTDTFTITAAEAVARSGLVGAMLKPDADALKDTAGTAQLSRAADSGTRTGPLAVTYSDWSVDNTDTDLNQTPLSSPTVFNFFLPDYQFPGLLGSAGLITPEFELTSETSVIRQANFFNSGIFNDGLGQLGLASFRSGNRDIFVDLRPWMGLGPNALPWVHNNNLGAFLDELNTLLMAGQLPSSGTNTYGTGTPQSPRVIVNAKDAIQTYLASLPYTKAITGISVASPCVLTVNSHGLITGQTVTVAGVTGGNFPTPINGTFTVNVVNGNTFTLMTTGSPPVAVNRLSGGSPSLSLTTANISIAAGFPDLVRDRVRSAVYLLITSPDFIIQK